MHASSTESVHVCGHVEREMCDSSTESVHVCGHVGGHKGEQCAVVCGEAQGSADGAVRPSDQGQAIQGPTTTRPLLLHCRLDVRTQRRFCHSAFIIAAIIDLLLSTLNLHCISTMLCLKKLCSHILNDIKTSLF